ncbi:type IV secretion system protein [Cupriavidus sp. D39]|uniref:type IV secretion system protein n=1 Tax=Cupriavidus sp. D39 TaxID=2997877 RepID=UPI0022712A7A|nr:type IV secretion system protein [Cupriavidus sp. D39]MCY0853042.1 type IV secretion system protein [Cupriavidus sp. D39]
MLWRKKADQGAAAVADIDNVGAGADKAPAKAKKKGRDAVNPFVEHQRHQDDRYMNLAKAKANWQVAFCMQTALLSISIAFNGYALLKPKFQPYVVVQDQIGHVVAVGPVDQSNPIDSRRIIRGQTIEWVENARAVIGDLKAAKKNFDWVYARVAAGSPAKKKLDEFYRQREPYKTAATSSAVAVVTLALPIGGNTWDLEWTEEWRNLQGEVLRKERWKVKLTYAIVAQDSEENIRRNPAGYMVTDFSWSKQSGI